MKLKLAFPFLLLCVSSYAQELSFEVHGKYIRAIPQEKVQAARYMSDLMSGYPSSWISDYVSVEVSGTLDGKPMNAMGVNDTLTAAQRYILSATDQGADIKIEIAYLKMNAVTDEMETRFLTYQATVRPDQEAIFIGGSQEMNLYLNEKVILKLGETAAKALKEAVVLFTVNEHGEIANASMAVPSGDQAVDLILLEAIKQMPTWTPAVNADGLHVKQIFEFKVGTAVKGC